jgi:hypothetical protein
MRQLMPMSSTCHGFMQAIELQTSTKVANMKLISVPAADLPDLPDIDLQSLHHRLVNLEGLIWLNENNNVAQGTALPYPRLIEPVTQILDLRVSSNGLATLNKRCVTCAGFVNCYLILWLWL